MEPYMETAARWSQPDTSQYLPNTQSTHISHDSGLGSQHDVVKCEPDHGWSDELDTTNNASAVSSDSGYLTSHNLSMNSTSSTIHNPDITGDDLNLSVKPEPLKMTETACDPSLAPLFDDSYSEVKTEPVSHGLVRLDEAVTSHYIKVHSAPSVPGKPFGFYSQQAPVHIQPKPNHMDESRSLARLPAIMSNSGVSASTVHQQLALNNPGSRRQQRARKSRLIPKVDEYVAECVEPSQELLAARRLLEEALITGNIVSQARTARMDRKLEALRLKAAQRSSIIQSFTKKARSGGSAVEPPSKRQKIGENIPSRPTTSKCSRVLYQENKRLEGSRFTWKIGYNGQRKSFKKICVKKSGKKKRKQTIRRHGNRAPLADLSGDSDDNLSKPLYTKLQPVATRYKPVPTRYKANLH